MTLKTLRSVPYSYDVLVDEETGQHFLEALCGGIAAFSVRVELTPDETQRFRDDPERGLEALAREVQQFSGRAPSP